MFLNWIYDQASNVLLTLSYNHSSYRWLFEYLYMRPSFSIIDVSYDASQKIQKALLKHWQREQRQYWNQ